MEGARESVGRRFQRRRGRAATPGAPVPRRERRERTPRATRRSTRRDAWADGGKGAGAELWATR